MFDGEKYLGQKVSILNIEWVVFYLFQDRIHCLNPLKEPWAFYNLRRLATLNSKIHNVKH